MLVETSEAHASSTSSTPGARPAPRETAGVFLLCCAAPLLVLPSTAAPFVDGKLVAVVAAALLLAPAAARAHRTLRLAVGVWLGAVALATLLGVDAWASLLGAETRGNGFVMHVAAGMALLGGAGMRARAAELAPRLIVWTALGAAMIGIAGRWWSPALLGGTLDLTGSTLGHHAFLGAFLGTAVVVGAATGIGGRGADLAVTVFLCTGLSISGNRGGLIGALLGLVVVALRDPARRTAARRVAVTVVAVSALWTAVGSFAGEQLSGGQRFTQIAEGSAQDRVTVWQVAADAGAARPLLGWGPGNGWGAILAHTDADQMRDIGRGWADAHDLFLHAFLTTGILGLATLLALLVVVARRARAGGRPRAWALAAAAALLVPHLLQPMHVALTPLLFLLLGIAAGPPASRVPSRIVPAVVALLVAAMLGIAGVRAVASTFEGYATAYGSQRAARAAIALEPHRASVLAWLARQRAIDGHGDVATLAARAVASRPWDGGVALLASDAMVVAGDLDAARRFLDEHLSRFPFDPAAMTKRALLELRAGDIAEARRWAARALELDPGSPAMRIVDEAAS